MNSVRKKLKKNGSSGIAARQLNNYSNYDSLNAYHASSSLLDMPLISHNTKPLVEFIVQHVKTKYDSRWDRYIH